MDWRHAAVIADAAACGAVSWDSESRAGEMLQPAGYRPAGAWVRAGAGLRGAGGSVGMSCVRFALVLRFWRGVLCSSCACHTFSIGMSLALDLRLSCGSLGMSYVRSRLLFDALRQAERLAGGYVSIPPWVEIAISAFSNWRCGYRAWRVHFGLARFFVAIPTEDEGTRKRGTESAARCGRVFA